MFGFDGYGMGFGGFQIFQLLFFIAFFGIFLVFLISAGKGIAQWGKNNRSPRLTVNAAVVAKRENVNVHHHHGNGATEGDTGLLTFQGTRYLSFERQGTAVSYQAETSEGAENGNRGERRSWDPEL